MDKNTKEKIQEKVGEFSKKYNDNHALYKYRNFNREQFENTYDALEKGYLFFAYASLMNDRFDTKLNINSETLVDEMRKYYNSKKEDILRQWFTNSFQTIFYPSEHYDGEAIFAHEVFDFIKAGIESRMSIKDILEKIPIDEDNCKKLQDFIVDKIQNYESYVENEILPKFKNGYQQEQLTTALYCMSSDYNIDSMWAYYGDNNKGFCIEYDLEKIKELYINGKLSEETVDAILYNLNFNQVKYGPEEKFDLIKFLDRLIFYSNRNCSDNPFEIYEQQLLHKDLSWQQEKEWRFTYRTDHRYIEKSENKNGVKIFIDIVSAIYIDREALSLYNAQKLIALANKKNWKIKIREISKEGNNYTYSDYVHKEFEQENKKNVLDKVLNATMSDLYKFDLYLIRHIKKLGVEAEDIHLSERSIVFRYGLYLQDRIKNTIFEDYNIDCEYNRNIDLEKKYHDNNGKVLGCYPDIIIHKRGTNGDNLLVIEIKTWWNTNTEHDEDKLRDLTKQTSDYRYEYGLSITLGKDENSVKMKWFQNGVEIE